MQDVSYPSEFASLYLVQGSPVFCTFFSTSEFVILSAWHHSVNQSKLP